MLSAFCSPQHHLTFDTLFIAFKYLIFRNQFIRIVNLLSSVGIVSYVFSAFPQGRSLALGTHVVSDVRIPKKKCLYSCIL